MSSNREMELKSWRELNARCTWYVKVTIELFTFLCCLLNARCTWYVKVMIELFTILCCLLNARSTWYAKVTIELFTFRCCLTAFFLSRFSSGVSPVGRKVGGASAALFARLDSLISLSDRPRGSGSLWGFGFFSPDWTTMRCEMYS
jgi:hypothetical protein